MKERLAVAVLLVCVGLFAAGCGAEITDDLYVEVKIEQNELMFSEALEPEKALEKAAENHDTTVEAVREYQAELEKDPDHLKAVNERINQAADELFQPSLLPPQ